MVSYDFLRLQICLAMKLIKIGAPREAQQIFPIKLTSDGDIDIPKNERIVSGSRVSVLANVDPNPSNVCPHLSFSHITDHGPRRGR